MLCSVITSFGKLQTLTEATGSIQTYIIDGQNNVVARLTDGTLNAQFVQDLQGRRVATLNAAGQLSRRFIYGARPNTPDIMLTATSTFKIITDHLGSPRLVVRTSLSIGRETPLKNY